jgi:hypothetical protein
MVGSCVRTTNLNSYAYASGAGPEATTSSEALARLRGNRQRVLDLICASVRTLERRGRQRNAAARSPRSGGCAGKRPREITLIYKGLLELRAPYSERGRTSSRATLHRNTLGPPAPLSQP